MALSNNILQKIFQQTDLIRNGLYISKNMVEAHEGKIWAHNNSDGQGTTFTFSIPLIKEEEQHLTDRQ